MICEPDSQTLYLQSIESWIRDHAPDHIADGVGFPVRLAAAACAAFEIGIGGELWSDITAVSFRVIHEELVSQMGGDN